MKNNTNTKPGFKHTSLGWIPDDWEVKNLADLGEFLKGKGILREQVIETGHPCIRYGEIYTTYDFVIKEFVSFINEDVAKDSQLIRNGDILFAGSGETIEDIGKAVAYIGNEKAFAGGDIVILSTKVQNDPIFISYGLSTEIANKQKRKLGQGQQIVHIYPSDLAKLKLLLPPLPEQTLIAQLLTTWDRAIETTQKLIAQKELRKKWFMQQLLTGKKRLKGFGGEWNEYKIAQLGKVITGNTPSMSIPEYYGNLYYWATAFDFNGIYINNTHVKLSEMGKKVARLVPKGSVLVTCIASIGKNAITNVEMAFNQQINAIIPTDSFNSEFIYYKIESSLKVLREVAGAGAVPIINKSSFENIRLAFPSIEEQTAISQVLQTADKEIQLFKNKLDKLKEQKKGLMQVLLTGKKRLRVE